MEWSVIFGQGMYETQIHIPIYVDIFSIHHVFQISRTPIFWHRNTFIQYFICFKAKLVWSHMKSHNFRAGMFSNIFLKSIASFLKFILWEFWYEIVWLNREEKAGMGWLHIPIIRFFLRPVYEFCQHLQTHRNGKTQRALEHLAKMDTLEHVMANCNSSPKKLTWWLSFLVITK